MSVRGGRDDAADAGGAASQRGAGSPPTSPQQAVELLLSRVRSLACAAEVVPLREASGRVLASDLRADRPSPAIDVSSMDGYALRRSDLAGLKSGGTGADASDSVGARALTLQVAGEVRIGTQPPDLPPGRALKIVTGAAIPPGADAVVKREDVSERAGEIGLDGAIAQRLRAGENIRRRGENLGAGDVVVPAGTLVTPAVAGALATFGAANVGVRPRVAVGIVVTGDEVMDVAASPADWQLRDSNGAALEAIVRSRRWMAPPLRLSAVDEEPALREAFERALGDSDAVLATGGVSMGDRDLVPRVLAGLGCEVLFHKLPQRPGRPMLAAISPEGKPVLALPGNPVSVMVTARRIGLAVLARLAGLPQATGAGPDLAPAVVLTNPDTHTIPLWWHRLVRIVGPGRAELVEGRGSGDLVSAARSDGFVELPPGGQGAGPWAFYAW